LRHNRHQNKNRILGGCNKVSFTGDDNARRQTDKIAWMRLVRKTEEAIVIA